MIVELLTAAPLLFFPPPAPDDEPDADAESENEDEDAAAAEGDDAETDDSGAPAAPPTNSEPQELDSRGYPVMRYSEADQDPGRELEWSDEMPEQEQLEYAESEEPTEELEWGEGVDQHGTNPAALERQGPTLTTTKKRRRGQESWESPQRFAFELKFGPYVPAVDRQVSSGLGPYAQIYGPTDSTGQATGQPKPGLFSALAFDWQFIYLGGPLSVGTSVGFFRDRAQALVASPDPNADTVRAAADKTTFNVLPVTLLAGYRFELLADRVKVPLVPYAKGGLAYGFWWSTDGSGKVSENTRGEKGRGGSLGWQLNAGLMLRLDFIDRASSRTLDRTTGINHTYLFGEYQISRLNGFGTGTFVDVGEDTWLVGLAIEF